MSVYRHVAIDTEECFVVPEGNAGSVLVELLRQGWSIVGREGAGWRLLRRTHENAAENRQALKNADF